MKMSSCLPLPTYPFPFPEEAAWNSMGWSFLDISVLDHLGLATIHEMGSSAA